MRKSSNPYRWSIGEAPLSAIANQEKKVPRNFITADGFGITGACRRYLQPLIGGEDYPPYRDGLPAYVTLKVPAVFEAPAPTLCGIVRVAFYPQ